MNYREAEAVVSSFSSICLSVTDSPRVLAERCALAAADSLNYSLVVPGFEHTNLPDRVVMPPRCILPRISAATLLTRGGPKTNKNPLYTPVVLQKMTVFDAVKGVESTVVTHHRCSLWQCVKRMQTLMYGSNYGKSQHFHAK